MGTAFCTRKRSETYSFSRSFFLTVDEPFGSSYVVVLGGGGGRVEVKTNLLSRLVHGESNLMFILSSDKDQRKNRFRVRFV